MAQEISGEVCDAVGGPPRRQEVLTTASELLGIDPGDVGQLPEREQLDRLSNILGLGEAVSPSLAERLLFAGATQVELARSA